MRSIWTMNKEIKNKVLLLIGDVFFLYLSLFFVLLIRYRGIPQSPSLKDFFLYFSWLFLLWLFFLWMFDFYSLKLRAGSLEFFRFLSIFIFLCLLSGALYFYLQPNLPVSPKAIFILDIVIFFLFFVGWRYFFDFVFQKRTKKEKVLILGNPPEIEDLLFFLKKFPSYYTVKVIPEIDKEKLLEISDILKKENPQKIIIANHLEFLANISFFSHIPIESFAHFYEEITQKVALSALNDVRFLEDFYKSEERSYVILKRIFDIFLSLIGLLILGVLFPFIALAIKLDSPGPVFFTQERVGKKRKVFCFYKFRSMYASPREKTDLWREKDKKEITKVGRFLRLTHLDELPQVINILKGDISFVGPRPEWKKIAEKLEKDIPFYFLRYRVQPGLSGWAQINIPPSTSIQEAKEKFQYDLYYLKHRSFLFDLVIFLKSLRKIFG